MKRIGITFLFYAFAWNDLAIAKDFGNKGANYPIAEESILVMIQRKLAGLDLKKEEEKMVMQAEERIKNPTPVRGISLAKNRREFLFDPTYTLEKDVILPCGKVLYRAGTKVNPLERENLDRRLFFVDARDEEQVKWLIEELKTLGEYKGQKLEDRIILVGGSPLKLKEELGQEVYFDQIGELVTKFGIRAVPAVVIQEDLSLKIVEEAIGTLK